MYPDRVTLNPIWTAAVELIPGAPATASPVDVGGTAPGPKHTGDPDGWSENDGCMCTAGSSRFVDAAHEAVGKLEGAAVGSRVGGAVGNAGAQKTRFR